MISINSRICGYEDVIRKPLICTFCVYIAVSVFFFFLAVVGCYNGQILNNFQLSFQNYTAG